MVVVIGQFSFVVSRPPHPGLYRKQREITTNEPALRKKSVRLCKFNGRHERRLTSRFHAFDGFQQSPRRLKAAAVGGMADVERPQ